MSANVNPDHSEDARKMYVGGFPPETTSEELAAHFGQYGEVESHVILRKEQHPPNPPRVFGFITFCDADHIDECFKNRPHHFNGSELDIKRAVPKGNTLENFMNKTKKLFISKLASNSSSEALEKYLKSKFPNTDYGTFEKVNLVMEKDAEGKPTDVCKGYGFAEVSSEEFADKVALMMYQFDFNGRKCQLVKSKPMGPKGGPNRGGYGGGGGYGGYNYYGGYGGNYGGNYGGGWGNWGGTGYQGGQHQGQNQNQGYGQRYRPY